MTANTYSASQREAQQTRSGLKHTDAERTYAGGLGVVPNKRTEPFSREGKRANGVPVMQCAYKGTPLVKLEPLVYKPI